MSNLSKEMKKLMEREFRQYKENKRLLNSLNEDSENPSRAILICKKRIDYIEYIYNSLTPFEKQMYDYIFNKNYDWSYCETHFNISKSTYYNLYNKFLNSLAKEWGKV